MRPSPPSYLRLLALPLSRSVNPSTPPPPFLLHAVRQSLVSPTADDSQPKTRQYLNRAIGKAADLWAGLGKADGGWKRKTYDLGERMMDRIEYEEWALKAIDPALAPKLLSSRSSSSDLPSKPAQGGQPEKEVELLYPPSLLQDEQALVAALKEQLDHREPHHRSAMWRCLLLSPLTWPFAIIPIVPNLPLFYVLWRAWSHFRAWKASQYLSSLIGSPSLRLLPSKELDEIYSAASSSDLLLSLDRVPRLVKRFGMDTEEQKELERAVGQSEARLKQATEARQADKKQD
ncbi:Mrx19p [Rhodotorula paludigena]|uniref:Mrx19p n=1 Tax=Rhodotorula paludigena TaxID=86838 RepID=UPI00317E1FE1